MDFPQKLTVKWIKERYSAGELTPATLVEEIVRRADAAKEKNIWIIAPSLQFAKPYLEALSNKKGPLWGIPFGVKDNIDMAGIPTTAACPAYSYTPKENALVITKLLNAGAIPVGKTNMDQFATGLTGIRSPYGEVHNALQPELISGGSSSGSGAAVGAGLVPFAIGTDTGGSGRGPAALNCVVGYKPPLGSWSGRGVVPCCLSIDTVSVFANNLEDALLVDDAARGFDPDFLFSREFSKNVIKPPEKVLLPTRKPKFFGTWADVYESKWARALNRIEKLGMEIGTADESVFEEATEIYAAGSITAERWGYFKEFVDSNPGALLPITENVFRAMCTRAAADVFVDITALKALKNKTRKMLEGCVFIWPTVGGTFTRDEVRNDPIAKNGRIGDYMYFCNPLDLCAVSLPENLSDREFPFGITMYALPSSEDILCYTAEKFMNF